MSGTLTLRVFLSGEGKGNQYQLLALGDSLLLGRFLSEGGSLVGSGTTSFAVFSFSTALTWPTSLRGRVEGGRALAKASLLRLGSLGALSALELEGPDAPMARG